MSSWLERRNPTVKLAVLTAVSLGTLFLFDPAPLLALYLLAVLAVRRAARVRRRTLLAAQVPFLLFGVGLVAVNALSRPGQPLWPEAPVRVTVEGVVIGAALALRGLVIGVLTVGFLASTPPRDLMISLIRNARLSPRYAYAILAGHRMLHAMPGRWATIRAAHAVRGPVRRDGRPRFGPAEFARAAFGLLVASIRSSERVALALESRGLGDGPRTSWRAVPLDRRDAVLAVTVAATFALVIMIPLMITGH
ncbi:MAG TPA: energy-coupling factor transporter transmembrane component T [Microlunatus sp.]|nr:energy-coupling factor transporter transmembrane component T [Microlunatus sp.]